MELKAKHKAAFCAGAFGKDVVYMLIASYLLYYYNTVLGMNSIFIGTVMMAARVFDAFNDPLMGIVVAKTHTRWGRFRPWILAGTVLNAFTIYALFATPSSMTESGQRVWLTVFYLLWGMTYTLMDIPFWSMIPAITKPGKDRESLSSLARSFSGIGDAIPTVLTMIIVCTFSGVPTDDYIASQLKIGFQYWALIVAIVFVISEIIFVLIVPEKVDNQSMQTTGLGDMFKALVKNDQAMTIVFSVILVYTAINIVGNLILYFFQYDVGDVGPYSVFTAVCFGTQVLIMLCFPVFRKFFSKNQLFMTGFVIQIAGFLIILLMAFTNFYQTNGWGWLCLPGVIVYAGYGTLNVLLTIFLADSVDYGEYKNGSREESVIFSMQTFTVKLASGLAVFIAGIVIDLIKLDVNAAAQSAATLNGLRLWMTLPSILLLVCGIIVFKKFYKLNDAKMDEIMNALGRKQEADE